MKSFIVIISAFILICVCTECSKNKCKFSYSELIFTNDEGAYLGQCDMGGIFNSDRVFDACKDVLFGDIKGDEIKQGNVYSSSSENENIAPEITINQQHISYYPTPSNRYVNFHVGNIDGFKFVSIRIVDGDAHVLYKTTYQLNNQKIFRFDISNIGFENYEVGMFFYAFLDENMTIKDWGNRNICYTSDDTIPDSDKICENIKKAN